MDLLNLRSSIPSQLVLSGPIDDAAIFNILAIIKEKIHAYEVFSIFLQRYVHNCQLIASNFKGYCLFCSLNHITSSPCFLLQ